jgi:WD40 repeat protein
MRYTIVLLFLLVILQSAAQVEIVPQLSRLAYITATGYSNSQQVIATAEYRVSKIVFWDARTKLRITSLTLKAPVVSIATDAQGRYFVAASENGEINVIDAVTLQVIQSLDFGAKVAGYGVVIMEYMPVTFINNDQFAFVYRKELGSTTKMQLSVWSISEGKERKLSGMDEQVQSLFTASGKQQLGIMHAKGIKWIDVATATITSNVLIDSLDLSRFSEQRFLYTPGGDKVLILFRGSNTGVLYNTQNGKKLLTIDSAFSGHFAGNDSLLIQTSRQKMMLYHTGNGGANILPVSEAVPWAYHFIPYEAGMYGLITPTGIQQFSLNSLAIASSAYVANQAPYGLAATDTGSFMYAWGSTLYEFNYRYANFKKIVYNFAVPVYRTLFTGNEDQWIVETLGDTDSLFCVAANAGKLLWKRAIDVKAGKVAAMSINREKTRLLVLMGRSVIKEFDLATGEVLTEMKSSNADIYDMEYSGDLLDSYVGLMKVQGSYTITKFGPRIKPFSYESFQNHLPIRTFQLSNNREYACYSYPEDGRFYVKPMDKDSAVKTVQHNARVFAFSPDDRLLATGSFSGGWVKLFRFPSLAPYAEYKCGDGKVFDLSFSADGRWLFAVLEDGWVTMINTTTREDVAKILLNESNFLVLQKQGFYRANKSQVEVIGLRTGNRSNAVSNADIKYNRPDKVLGSIAEADAALIGFYSRAYYKRLKKLSIDSTALNTLIEFPRAEIVNAQLITPRTSQPFINLPVKFTSGHLLHSFNVWVNDVPLFGSQGYRIAARRQQQLDTTISIPLEPGQNIIEVEAMLANGIKSTRDIVKVQSTFKAAPAKLYFIGIGIDKFAESQYNLQYSVKDIRNLAAAFKKRYGTSIIIDTLFNKQVSVAAVKALKAKLAKTQLNDKVIIAYSGHGLLSNNFDYYLSTYNINFNKPEENGLAYETLEGLLDSIPARKKLMLIDACHSGEVDKDELVKIEQAADSMKLKKGLTIVIKKKEGQMGLGSSFELMQELFVNVGRTTGANIISAAAGTQFALERNDLQNGVFTYCILKAMQQYPHLKVSELKAIVGSQVELLTNGMQRPTSRAEANKADWEIW